MPELSQNKLTPRHQRILEALKATREGILSFELRRVCGCQNIADEVKNLRRRGFKIKCEMESYTTQDGQKSRIGRYVLVQEIL